MRVITEDRELGIIYPWLGLFLVLCLSAILQIQIYRDGFRAITADEFGRIIVAARWSENPHLIWGGGWLPFSEYLFGIALKLKWELLWIPRIIASVFGLASIVFMYLLSLSIFNNHLVAMTSALLMAVNPMHVQLSSVPLTEILYGSLILGMAWSFFRYLISHKNKYLVITTFFLALANGFRFESWLFSSLLIIFLLVELNTRIKTGKDLREGLLLIGSIFLIIAFPVIWMIGSFFKTGDFLASLDIVRTYKNTWQASGTDYLAYGKTIFASDPFMTIMAPFGIGFMITQKGKSRVKLWYIALATIPLLMFISLHRGQIEPPGIMFRYMGLFSFLLYPAVAYLMFIIIHRFSRSERVNQGIVLGLVICIIIFQVSNNIKQINNDLSAPGLEVGQKIRTLRSTHPRISEEPVMIELSYWEYLAIEVGANDINGVLYDRPLDLENHQSDSWISRDFQAFLGCLASARVSYVIVKSPILKETIEKRFGYTPTDSINNYSFFPVLESVLVNPQPSGTCPSN